jgi:coproporphyrinogen III oxidase-like Fe-S oxidoreductase
MGVGRGIAERSRWPYPAMVPYSIKMYPIVQTAAEVGPQPPEAWPPPMRSSLIDWRNRGQLDGRSLNQIYLHVPFCPFICHFCPLYKVTANAERTDESKEAFVEALLREIAAYGRNAVARGQIYDSIYFGGGTPTELTPAQLARILTALRATFRLAPDPEITLEGVARQMLAPEYLEPCLEAGFNRVSFGVQSLEERLRKRIGRGDEIDDYLATARRVKALRPGAIVNVEIMAGLPEQSLASLAADVNEIVSWPVDSADVLYYVPMPGTRLQSFIQLGQRAEPLYGGSMLEMRRLVNASFAAAGFQQLTGEVFSRSDRDLFTRASYGGGGNCLNTVLALGPSSFGLLGGVAYHNVASLRKYVADIDQGLFPVRAALPLTGRHARSRAWAFSVMRLHIPDFLVVTARERRRVRRWSELGLVRRTPGGWDLTAHGRAWYNHMQTDVLPLAEQVAAARMFGSSHEQQAIFADPTEDSLNYELHRAITGRNAVVGRLRRLVYRTFLAAQARRGAGHALTFTGSRAPVRSARRDRAARRPEAEPVARRRSAPEQRQAP